MIIVYILLFLLMLSLLVMVHEAGHLATAKIFKVYCFEYAIGFGPKIFSKKRKNGETYFSIRAIPFGGFVSMYGESETVPEGIEVDPSRSLLAISKWKRAIIMFAGVFMNFVLALVIFFIFEIGFPYYVGRYGHVTIVPGSLAYQAGLKDNDSVYAMTLSSDKGRLIFYDDNASVSFSDSHTENAYVGFNYNTLTIKDTSLLNHAVIYSKSTFGELNYGEYPQIDYSEIDANTYEDEVYERREFTAFLRSKSYKVIEPFLCEITLVLTENCNDQDQSKAVLATFNIDLTGYTSKNYDHVFYKLKTVPINSEITVSGDINVINRNGNSYKNFVVESYKMSYPDLVNASPFAPGSGVKSISFNVNVLDDLHPNKKGEAKSLVDVDAVFYDDYYHLHPGIGINMQIDKHKNSFKTAVKNTFTDFGDSSVAIYKGLEHLFTTKDGWKDVGGIIAIGVSTTQMLQQNGFGMYLYYWGLISVNLGIINLLPFPGLDGWHLLVLAVEGIFRKEIPSKVKNIISAVGVLLLLGLMVLIVIKDVVGLF